MKKFIFSLSVLLTLALSANAMSYEQARQQALFLTDKMAYELNLTEEQYEAAFEINLDYLLSINDYNDLYGPYWQHRNLDFSYILLDWQYRAFLDATYFYRPLYWSGGFWHFAIYARYPHRDYFYFGRPHFYSVYRGGHSWRMNGGHSWYKGRSYAHQPAQGNRGGGMRDRFDRGDYGHGGPAVGHNGDRGGNRGNGVAPRGNNGGMNRDRNTTPRSSFGEKSRQDGSRQSSTRTTVGNRYNDQGSSRGSNSGVGTRPSTQPQSPRSTFSPSSSNRSVGSSARQQSSSSSRSIGTTSSSQSRSVGSSSSSRSTSVRSSSPSPSRSSVSSSPSPSRSSMSSSSSRGGSSMGGGRSGGSMGGGRSGGGGGGSHMGGHR